MAEDKSVVKQVEAPPLTPLNLTVRLAPTPRRAPKYSVKVKNAAGQEVILGDPRATRALLALMDVHAVNDGGHTENGIYALRANYGFDKMTFEDLKPFRSIKSKFTGHGESHLNPEGVLLSNGPLGSALPQSQGLALADRVAKRDRVTICTVSDGASMEGEAKEAFAAIPGLAAKGRVNPYLLVISDNDTKLSGRITKDAYSMQPTFSAISKLGWKVISVPNGHDLQAVYLAVEKGIAQAKSNPNSPVCLWTKTIKGYGIKATAENPTGGHGFPLSNGEKIVDWVNEIYSGKTH